MGRKRAPEASHDSMILVRIRGDETTRHALRACASERGMTLADWLREALLKDEAVRQRVEGMEHAGSGAG